MLQNKPRVIPIVNETTIMFIQIQLRFYLQMRITIGKDCPSFKWICQGSKQQFSDLNRLRMLLMSVSLRLADKYQSKWKSHSLYFTPFTFPPVHIQHPTSASLQHTRISRLLKSKLSRLFHYRQMEEIILHSCDTAFPMLQGQENE